MIARAEMLAELMRMKYGVAVGGSHGKTTTTSMVAAVLARGGLDPTIVVGGRLHALGANARLGHGQFLVAEADESDGSFLRLAPAVAVITNVDREHLDHYKDLDDIRQAFIYFANRVPFYGVSHPVRGRPEVRGDPAAGHQAHVALRHAPRGRGARRSSPAASRTARASVVARWWAVRCGEVELRVPGRHNVLNALAAVAVGLELEVGFGHVAEALAEFRGVGRRFETRGECGGVRVIDDYGHHPTEIAATLAAARGLGGRVLVIFQPHRYTRTAALAAEFGAALREADRVWVLDVYAAGESPIEGVSAATLVSQAKGHRAIAHAPDPHAAAEQAAREARPGDVVLTLGAGDVWKLADEVLVHLRRGAGVAGASR